MPLAYIRPAGEHNLYHVHFLDAGAGHPDQGLPGGGLHPGNRPPGSYPGHPDQGLPGGGGHPSHPISGPGRPVDPGYGRPGGGGGGIPDNSLPDAPPPTLMPGWTLLLVRGPDGKWKYATLAPSSPPPRPLPEPIPPGGQPDQGLPPQPPQPDQGLPPGAPPVAGQPLPPTPAPTRR